MKYSEAENALLLDQLRSTNGVLAADDFPALEDLWPGFFNGRTRKAYDLHIQMVLLAKKNGIDYKILSIPKRIRNRHSRPKVPTIKKQKLSEQILCIIQSEFAATGKRITVRVMGLLGDLSKENMELKEEIRKLKPFKDLVEDKYKQELEFRGG